MQLLLRLVISSIAVASAFSLSATGQQFQEVDGLFSRKDCKALPGKTKPDSICLSDPITNSRTLVINDRSGYPATINGDKIYEYHEVGKPASVATGQQTLKDHLFTGMDNMVRSYFRNNTSLQSLRIDIRNVVADKTGNIVFYQLGPIKGLADGRARILQRDELSARISELMSKYPAMKPAQIKGRNVAAYTNLNLGLYNVKRAGNDISIVFDGGDKCE
jgi:hypothetical protein